MSVSLDHMHRPLRRCPCHGRCSRPRSRRSRCSRRRRSRQLPAGGCPLISADGAACQQMHPASCQGSRLALRPVAAALLCHSCQIHWSPARQPAHLRRLCQPHPSLQPWQQQPTTLPICLHCWAWAPPHPAPSGRAFSGWNSSRRHRRCSRRCRSWRLRSRLGWSHWGLVSAACTTACSTPAPQLPWGLAPLCSASRLAPRWRMPPSHCRALPAWQSALALAPACCSSRLG